MSVALAAFSYYLGQGAEPYHPARDTTHESWTGSTFSKHQHQPKDTLHVVYRDRAIAHATRNICRKLASHAGSSIHGS